MSLCNYVVELKYSSLAVKARRNSGVLLQSEIKYKSEKLNLSDT